MSDEIQQGADGIRPGAETAGNALFRVVVKCYRNVYRRAGIPFTRGENTLVDVTASQLEILRRDSVLKIVSETPASPSPESGAVDHVDVGTELNPDLLNAAQLTARILAVVKGLDKSKTELFTTAGTPKVAAVSAVLGETITAEQLKTALASVTDGDE